MLTAVKRKDEAMHTAWGRGTGNETIWYIVAILQQRTLILFA
jgi:hypothetical protein